LETAILAAFRSFAVADMMVFLSHSHLDFLYLLWHPLNRVWLSTGIAARGGLERGSTMMGLASIQPNFLCETETLKLSFWPEIALWVPSG